MTEDSKVVGLFGGVATLEVSAEVIAECERLLERAKRGEIRALAYVTVDPGGSIGTGWYREHLTGYVLMAGSAMLHQRLVSAALSNAQASP
jgi:hypothetical protein